jgi:hypothetical protein
MGWAELAACVAGARARLAESAHKPREAQEALLRGILRRHAGSAFGRRHGFASLQTLADYQQAVPPCGPESLAGDVDAMARGETGLLVDEPLLAFERTGGSTGGARLVPLTQSGLVCLRLGLFAWLDDLQMNQPLAMQGTSYWSISPAARAASATPGGVPIGLASDAAYFGAAAPAIASVLAVPPAVALLEGMDDWRMVTLQCLLANPRLALVSVWSPTFWLELCRHAVARRDELAQAMAAGRWAGDVPTHLLAHLGAPVRNPQRARLVLQALSGATPDWAAIWPGLALVSCWTHASAAPWGAELARQFPDVRVQGKGLLATEGLISIPLSDGGDPVAAVTSTVLEFEADDGRVYACDEVQLGGEYGVLMTTSAGLYRYRLGDRVRVTGWWHATPRLLLLGRGAGGSDLCGEKLTEAFVMQCWVALGVPGGARLVPHAAPAPHYRLLVDAAGHGHEDAARLAVLVDRALRANPQYAYARDLGQLGPLLACRVPQLASHMQAVSLAQGQRLGDAKPSVLGRLGEQAPVPDGVQAAGEGS